MNLKSYLPSIKPYIHGDYNYKFTVFIPVYNGEKTIIRALESIEAQTFRDFEVLIINDGSTDATGKVVRDYMSESSLDIRFIDNPENINRRGTVYQGVSLAQGEFFLIHDADDSCFPDALRVFADAYESIPEELRHRVSGVTAHCVDQDGNLVGTRLTTNPLYCNALEFRYYHKIIGEKWGFTKTDILKQISIDESLFERGRIPDGYLWLTIAKEGYITKYIDDVTRVYFTDTENSLSKLEYSRKAFGMAIYSILFLNYFHRDYLLRIPKVFIRRLVSILKASNYLEYTMSTYFNSIESRIMKLLFLVLWPLRKIAQYA